MAAPRNKLIIRTKKAASPADYQLAIVSIDYDGNQGNLNRFVLQQLGYEKFIMPKGAMSEGYFLLDNPDRPPILFIATMGGKNSVQENLGNNLINGLHNLTESIDGKTIWLPTYHRQNQHQAAAKTIPAVQGWRDFAADYIQGGQLCY